MKMNRQVARNRRQHGAQLQLVEALQTAHALAEDFLEQFGRTCCPDLADDVTGLLYPLQIGADLIHNNMPAPVQLTRKEWAELQQRLSQGRQLASM